MRLGAAAWLCCVALALPAAAAAPPERFFDYLYIEASSGSSAGGHAAVRFDNEVYHFQHADPGIIRAATQSWASFDLSYRGLGNRPIHIQRVGVSATAYDRLRRTFRQRYVVQESHVRLLEGIERERRLLHCLATGEPVEHGACSVELPGAGYFFALGESPVGDRRSTPIAALCQEVDRRHGRDYLPRRQRELHDQIVGLRPPSAAIELPRDGTFASASPRFADVYSERLLEWLALGVLAGEAMPVRRAFRRLPDELTPEEREALGARVQHQRRVIHELLSSPRSDRGYALLIAMARLVALHGSLAADRLIVLDTYAGDETALVPSWVDEQRPGLEQIRDERRRQLQAARRGALAAPAEDEATWSRLEVAANVALELDDALERGRSLRWHQPALAPARSAPLQPHWPAPALSAEAAAAAADSAAAAQSQIEARLRALYRYDLIRRNCVTEIFRTIDEGDGGGDLGGRIDLGINATFIPFVSADAVRDAYAVREEQILPSYRQQGMDRLRRARRWTEVLREETAPIATLVPFDPADEVFLFFSEEHVALRPLVGVANVVFGAAGLVGGTLALPFDRGALFTASARGMFYSFPELAFINIRKGTIPLLPPTWDEERQ